MGVCERNKRGKVGGEARGIDDGSFGNRADGQIEANTEVLDGRYVCE